MASSIILKKSSVAARVPVTGDLAYGELALNYADGALYYKRSDNTIQNLIPASGGGGGSSDSEFTAIASGNIASAGLVVALNNDGTVSTAGFVGSDSVTTPTDYTLSTVSASTGYYDSVNNQVIVFYYVSNAFKYKIGSISGTAITFGTEQSIGTDLVVGDLALAYDTINNKLVLGYKNFTQSNAWCIRVITLSAGSLSLGAEVQIGVSTGTNIAMCFDPTNGKVIIALGNGNAYVGTVSGTTISFGTGVSFLNGKSLFGGVFIAFSTGDAKCIVGFFGTGNSTYASVGTVSGTTISFGTQVTITTNIWGNGNIVLAYNPLSANFLIAGGKEYTYPTNYQIQYATLTISGTSITVGTLNSFASTTGVNKPLALNYDATSQKMVMVYAKAGYGTLTTVNMSGTSSSINTEYTFESGNVQQSYAQHSIVYDSFNTQSIVLYTDPSSYSSYAVFSHGSSNADTYIGIAKASASDGATATIQVIGSVNTDQSGLTTNSSYFVAADGTLSTVNNGRKIGKALSATKLLVNTALTPAEMNAYLGSLVA